MKKETLRIGNIINFDGLPHKVVEVLEDRLHICWTKADKEIFKVSYDEIEGIPIVEKWLVGFKKDRYGNPWICLETHYLELTVVGKYFYPVYVESAEMSAETEQRVSLNRIEFLHELQNLFYILRQEELTLNINL